MGVIKYTDEYILELAEKLERYAQENEDKLFLVMSFVVDNGLYRELVKHFASRDERFASALKKTRSIEELRLAQAMVDDPKKVAPCIFALKNVSQWRDRTPDEARDSATRINVNNISADKASKLVETDLSKALAAAIQDQKSGNDPKSKTKPNA